MVGSKSPYLYEGHPIVAIVEALSHIRDSERVANMLHEWLPKVSGTMKGMDKDYRTFIIYALGSIGSPISSPVLEYYRDNCIGYPDGDAARIALEHFGKATFFEIKEIHDSHTKSKSGGCFIAIAVYGQMTPEVEVLRHFRDEVLLSSAIGRKLVSLYYLFSPHIATLIGKSTFAKILIKAVILKPVIWLISYRKICRQERG